MKKQIVIVGIILILLTVGLSGCNEQEQNNHQTDTDNLKPVAECSSSINKGLAPLTVQFTGSGIDADGTIVSYHWDFDDGTTSTEQNPNHTFQTVGHYLVFLTVTDNKGQKDSDSVTIDVLVTYPPTAKASSNKDSGYIPLVVEFYGEGTDDDGYIVSYHWNFGDGKTSSEQNPTHTFPKEGTYDVQLKVTDDKGWTDYDSILIKAKVSSEQYKSECRDDITYQELNSDAYAYYHEKVTYQGIIEQVISSKTFRVDVGYSDILYVTTLDSKNLVEDYPVQLWGKVLGYETYESIAGYTITIPHIEAKYFEKASFNYNIGEKVTWGGKEITIKSYDVDRYYSWTGSSGNSYLEVAGDGNTFLFINVVVKQISSDSEYVYPGDFWVVDTEGYKYDYDSGTYSMDGGLESTTLYQNQKVEGKICFEIPEVLSKITIQYNFGTSYNPILAEWDINL